MQELAPGQRVKTGYRFIKQEQLGAFCGRQRKGELGPLPTRVSVIAMGRFGGRETGYGSDADVMFVHDPLPGADEHEATSAAHAAAEELRALLALPGPEPPLLIDPGLRPEGRQGSRREKRGVRLGTFSRGSLGARRRRRCPQ